MNERRNGGIFVGLAAFAALVVAVLPKAVPTSSATKDARDQKTAIKDDAATRTSSDDGPLTPIRRFLVPLLDPAASTDPAWSRTQRYTLETRNDALVALVDQKNTEHDDGQRYCWSCIMEPGLRRLTAQAVACQGIAAGAAGAGAWPQAAVALRVATNNAFPLLQEPRCRIRFLIATVPDPYDSGFASSFDQTVAALQRALEQGGFVYDRAWLPWQPADGSQKAVAELHKCHPGLILFRMTPKLGKDRDNNKQAREIQSLLALLLVGETATGGIHHQAFRNAVRVILECPEALRDPADPALIRVLGPHFSGSATSLRMALEAARSTIDGKQWPQVHEPLIKVVCGSAGGFHRQDFVSARWAPENQGQAFEMTILPNRLVLHWLRKFLGKPSDPVTGASPAPLVLLHEANTGFGQEVVFAKASRDYLIPYPLHIAQLRTSYSKEQLARLEAQGLPHVGRTLPFPDEGGDNADRGREALHAQAPLFTTAINDLVIDNMITAFAHNRWRHICLLSTDPQDVVFLARRIHDRYPDVQLATIRSDLLYCHEDYNCALRGMIVASTYPLYPTVQGWSQHDGGQRDNGMRTRMPFPDDDAEGCYNAALVHLNGYRDRDHQLALLDYGWDSINGKECLPSIWLSVVGDSGQLVPITRISPAQYAKDLPEDVDLSVMHHGEPPPGNADFSEQRSPSMGYVLFGVLLIGFAWCFHSAVNMLRKSVWPDTSGGICCRFKQRIDFAVMCFAQILLFGEVAKWAWIPVRTMVGPDSLNLLIKFGAGMVLVGSLVTVLNSWRRLLWAYRLAPEGGPGNGLAALYRMVEENQALWLLGEPKPVGGKVQKARLWMQSGLWIWLAHATAFALVTLACAWYLVLNAIACVSTVTPEDALQFERVALLASGVSPLLPRLLLCAALFGWGFCLVKKLYLVCHHTVESPFPDDRRYFLFDNLRRLDQAVRAELEPPSTLRIHCWAGVGLLAATLAVFLALWADAVAPIDGAWFGRAMLLSFAVGTFLLLFTLLQLHSAWRVLRKMLRFLALLPMQEAFGRLNEKVVSLFGHYLFSQRPRHSHLAISVQQFEAMQRLFPAFKEAIEKGTSPAAEQAFGKAALAAVKDELHSMAAWPTVTADYARELDAVHEEDLDPPGRGTTVARKAAGSINAVQWGGQAGSDCTAVARKCLRILWSLWPAQTVQGAFGHATGHRSESILLALPKNDPIRAWALAAEDFVAAETLRYLGQFTAQIRTLLTSLTIGALLLLLAATVYPFYPQYLLLLVLTLLGGLVAAGIVSFLVQLNRDELVSRIAQNTPNRFTPDVAFIQGAAAYVLPILAAVTIQFPFVTSTIRSLLDPLFHIIR